MNSQRKSDAAVAFLEETYSKRRMEILKNEVIALLGDFKFDEANARYASELTALWTEAEFRIAVRNAKRAQVRKLAEQDKQREQSARDEIQKQIIVQIENGYCDAAEDQYGRHCTVWWTQADYETAKAQACYVYRFLEAYHHGSLAELDTFFDSGRDHINLTSDEFITLKLPKLRRHLAAIGIPLDEEQERANASPRSRLLIKARAGSGKTRTLCARAAVAIRDEFLVPNQVMILAFNKAAAAEIQYRVQKTDSGINFSNSRTFHSLAYQLVKPRKKLLFDAGGHPSAREQSRFVQRMLERILNPAFKEAMVEFFRKELEHIEDIGRDLPRAEYIQFRRALEIVTLGGERVKSNGEKFIADFLFEHGISYRYERAWAWKTDFLDGAAYKPDFSIVVNGQDFILEHWAIDPNNRHATVPENWKDTAEQYRCQILAKREFWLSKGIVLLETHTGLMQQGREEFEIHLYRILRSAGIHCQKRDGEDIMRSVFQNDFAISRIAELFMQFIQRCKKCGWGADKVAGRIAESPDKEPRTRLFHQLALRAYREYEAMLEEQHAMDFDDLLLQAAQEVKERGGDACIHLGEGQMMPISSLRWILLDEYQDFSALYFNVLDAILNVNPSIRLMAVGDDWQAINTFAGAEQRFFEQFSTYFPRAETVAVTTNYRSEKSIVDAGNRLMGGRGVPAKSSKSNFGFIETKYLDTVWIEYRQGEQFRSAREADALYLPASQDGTNPSERAHRLARVYKLCKEIILADPGKKTILVARTNTVYGVRITEFKTQLISILATFPKVDVANLEKNIEIMTAHGSKGQEAPRVIILDATSRQFPKIHPDNLLFEIFGVTPQTVLDEERRLFYVAITRAEQCLYLLTEKDHESPYLESLKNSYTPYVEKEMPRAVMGELAQRIQTLLESNAIRTKTDPWRLVQAKVPAKHHMLGAALRENGIPLPEISYQLPGEAIGVNADLAWPNASPPVAILSEEQAACVERWIASGWKIARYDLPTGKIVMGVRHYVLGKKIDAA